MSELKSNNHSAKKSQKTWPAGEAEPFNALSKNLHELDILFKELLISETNFFREAEAFDALVKVALPAVLESRPDDHAFRIWVPGCATGEEVLSLEILMREIMEAGKRHCDVQLFGTDLDNEAIELAHNGRFLQGISIDVPAQRLERYFTHDNNTYRIRKEVREMSVFAEQNVFKDPPFTKLDLISCRNLLIYLNVDLQRGLLPIFHYPLKPGGLLFLGSSESRSGYGDLFEVVEKSLYRMSKVFIDGLDPMLILDVAGRIVALNDEAERTYGWSREELMGQPVNVLVPEERLEAFAEQLGCWLQGGIICNVDAFNVTKAGKALSGMLVYSLLTDEQGASDGIALIVKFMQD